MKNKLVRLVRLILPRRLVGYLEYFYRNSRIRLISVRYGFPARGQRIIAVTGTDGKTTTCALINQMLKSAGFKTAMFTTAIVELNGKSEMNYRHTTVPQTAEIQGFLRKAKDNEADFTILEVTSHALDQYKLAGIPIEVAVITNLSQEHLDYHGTMDNYAAAKARLLTDYKPKVAVLNRDDDWYDFFARRTPGEILSFGKSTESDLKISTVKTTSMGSDFTAEYKGNRFNLSTQLPGDFNVLNSAAAAAVGLVLKLTPVQITQGIASLQSVPGRMERITNDKGFEVVVDYAVTPGALEKVLKSLKEATKGRLLLVFGATGDRDRSKRPVMGEVAAAYADLVFLTDDETYTENPEIIRQEVFKGIEGAGAQDRTQVIGDRKEAIKAALKAAKKGDTVLLTGIGHQNSRNMGGKQEPWDEGAIVKQTLATL